MSLMEGFIHRNRSERLLDAHSGHFYTAIGNYAGECFVKIVMNGEPREVESGTTVARLIAALKMQPRFLAVERNFELVPRARHAECLLADGDQLEIVTLVGGG